MPEVKISALPTAATLDGTEVLPVVQAGVTKKHTGLFLDKGNVVYNVKAYGAVGDNVADDTAAIQAAIDAATVIANGVGGAVVFVPKGTYKMTGELILKDRVSLRGAGVEATVLKWATDLGWGRYAIQPPLSGAGIQTSRPDLRDLRVSGPGGGSVEGGRTTKMRGVFFGNSVNATDVRIDGFGYGAVLGNDHNTLTRCKISNNYINVAWPDGPESKGNHALYSCVVDGPYFACVGVFGDNIIDGASFIGGHCGVGPYGFYKGDGGSAARTVPTGLAATGSGTGGTLAAGTYYYVVTAYTTLNVDGESFVSSQVSATLTGSTSSVALSWTAVAGATGYRVYRGTVSGTRFFLAEVTTNSYTDTGGAVSRDKAPTGASQLGMMSESSLLNFAMELCGNGAFLDESTGTGSGSDSLVQCTIDNPGFAWGGSSVRISTRPQDYAVRVRNWTGTILRQGTYPFTAGAVAAFSIVSVNGGEIIGNVITNMFAGDKGVPVRTPGGAVCLPFVAETAMTLGQLVQGGGGGLTCRPFGSFLSYPGYLGVAMNSATVNGVCMVAQSGPVSVLSETVANGGTLLTAHPAARSRAAPVPGSFTASAGTPGDDPIIGVSQSGGGSAGGSLLGVFLTPRGFDRNFVRPGAVSALPTPSATYRGQILRVDGGTGVADVAYICLKNASDAYAWQAI